MKIRDGSHDEKGLPAAAEEQATFNTRLPKRMKIAMQRAAELRGQTLSDFVLGSAYDRALQTISAETVLQLSERDSEAFARAVVETADGRRCRAHTIRGGSCATERMKWPAGSLAGSGCYPSRSRASLARAAINTKPPSDAPPWEPSATR